MHGEVTRESGKKVLLIGSAVKLQGLGYQFKRRWNQRLFYLLILPAIVSVFIFGYIPMHSVSLAFKDYKVTLRFNTPWYPSYIKG